MPTPFPFGAKPLDDPSLPPAAEAPQPDAPGLRQQLGATRAAAIRLVRAHTDLAKAEFADILDEVKAVAVKVGLAIAFLLFVGLLVPIGTLLFLGEWWFGSIGWGVLLGAEALIAVAIVLVVSAVGTSGGLGRDFIVAALVGVVVGVALGLDLTNQGWVRLGDQIAGNIDPAWRVQAVAAGTTAIVLGILLALVGAWRTRGIGGLLAGLIGGAILGAILGAFTAIAFGPRVGSAIGVAVGFAIWPALAGIRLWRHGIDMDEMKRRFYPSQTIETTKETIEWVREQTPLGPKF